MRAGPAGRGLAAPRDGGCYANSTEMLKNGMLQLSCIFPNGQLAFYLHSPISKAYAVVFYFFLLSFLWGLF